MTQRSAARGEENFLLFLRLDGLSNGWMARPIVGIQVLFLAFMAIAVDAGSTDKALGLHSDGGTWRFYPAAEVDAALPNVLLIGDSILGGYHGPVIEGLKGTANVDYWMTPMHLNAEALHKDLKKVVTFRSYDVIHFNIGLHGWAEGRIPEGKYPELMAAYVATLKQNAPGAKLIWASTTPVHERGTKVLNKEINPVIVERNRMADEVMKNEDVAVNDLYALMSDKLDLVRGDRFHWTDEASSIMATGIVSIIERSLVEQHSPK